MRALLSLCLMLFSVACAGQVFSAEGVPRVLELSAKDTLAAVELMHGDEVRFTLRSGQQRRFVLEHTAAQIIERNSGGLIYSFECRLRADGQPLTLRRYTCSQESFYEPWVVNGVRIWLSSSQSIFDLVPIRYPEDHHKLNANAILALQDATLPICPQPMQPWFKIDEHFLDVGKCYNGDDPWLGPYLGQACHVGMDFNMPKGTPLFAPIDFDTQWFFSADHRWRGVRQWPNGEVWALQSHHVEKLLVKPYTAIKTGTHYAEAAGKGVGSHQHSHFEFRIGPDVFNAGYLGGLEIDPWVVFWQIFETDKEARGMIRARMKPLSPAKTGEAVKFSAVGSRAGTNGGALGYAWTFGDGGSAHQAAPEYVFARPGIYAVTLRVDDGGAQAVYTEHLTVSGEAIATPALRIEAPDAVSFRPQPAGSAEIYGKKVGSTPNTLSISVRSSENSGTQKVVLLRNAGGGVLPAVEAPQVTWLGEAKDWLSLKAEGEGNQQQISVKTITAKLREGAHLAIVEVHCPGATPARQTFFVSVTVRPTPQKNEVIVDDRDSGFYATPGFWVGHQFSRCKRRGYQKRYLTNGGRSVAGEFVRFSPDLSAGRYEVSFHSETPFVKSRFNLRIRHSAGETKIQYEPLSSEKRSLGVFEFSEGADGFVEISAENSEDLIVVDAMVFKPVEGGERREP